MTPRAPASSEVPRARMNRDRRGVAWSAAPVVDWLLREGRLAADPLDWIDALASRLADSSRSVFTVASDGATGGDALPVPTSIGTPCCEARPRCPRRNSRAGRMMERHDALP